MLLVKGRVRAYQSLFWCQHCPFNVTCIDWTPKTTRIDSSFFRWGNWGMERIKKKNLLTVIKKQVAEAGFKLRWSVCRLILSTALCYKKVWKKKKRMALTLRVSDCGLWALLCHKAPETLTQAWTPSPEKRGDAKVRTILPAILSGSDPLEPIQRSSS